MDMDEMLSKIHDMYDVDESGSVSVEENILINRKLGELYGFPFDEVATRQRHADADNNHVPTQPDFLLMTL